MFKSRSEGNVVYKCSIRLLDDSFLELEFQVGFFQMLCIPKANCQRKSWKFELKSCRKFDLMNWKVFYDKKFESLSEKIKFFFIDSRQMF